jgi:hypothetical protein
MAAPDVVLELVERYERNRNAYLCVSNGIKKAVIRMIAVSKDKNDERHHNN